MKNLHATIRRTCEPTAAFEAGSAAQSLSTLWLRQLLKRPWIRFAA